ncbi:long-chain fatty acid--CoA ligase [Phaeobacter sp. NW0010-22]|uniref:acyl-CoA synthetase n=1 Tax=Phaeobacter sp. NW0010-22 TaxID=3135907 RepID=UPI003109E395
MRHYDWLASHAFTTPNKACWVDLHSRRSFTFEQANDRSKKLAAYLDQRCGVEKGDRVAVLAMNSTDMMEIHAACAKLGAIFLPLNWRLAAPELDFILSDGTPKVLIYDTANKELVEALTEALPAMIETTGGGGNSEYESAIAGSDGKHPTPEITHDDIWTILYTSGTTGRPKGAINTYGMAFINAVNMGSPWGITHQSIGLTVLPLFHTGGLNCFTTVMLHNGGCSLIMRTVDPGQILEIIDDPSTGLTHFFGVPAVYLFMSQHPSFDTTDYSRLVACGIGGAPSPVPLVKTYLKKNISLAQGFGMSETSPLVSGQTMEQAVEKPGSAGRCALHGELKVMRNETTEADSDEVGELWVRGPNITPGYWNRPEAKASDWVGDWFKTGDAARLDSDGDLWIVDRWKDMYISGGENVYPAEVENTLFTLEGIADGAIVGAPDDRWGEVGVAFVVLNEGVDLSEDDVIAHFHDKVARYKIPVRAIFMDVLPRNATGKVLKRVLRDQI